MVGFEDFGVRTGLVGVGRGVCCFAAVWIERSVDFGNFGRFGDKLS